MKKLILSALVLSTLIACDEGESKKMPKEKGFTIDVELSGVKDSTMVYLKNENREILDSTYALNEKFNFTGKLNKEPATFEITSKSMMSDGYFYKDILIGNENIIIKSDKENFQFTTNAKGSKYQDFENKKNELTKELYKERNILTDQYRMSTEKNPIKIDSIRKFTWDRVHIIDSIIKNRRINFIKENLNNYTSINELGSLADQFSKKELNELFQKFSKEIQESSYGEKAKTYLEVNLLNIGDTYADFSAQDQDGNQVKLSELRNHKYTLIDFSTTYCGPCIESIPELKEIADIHKDNLQLVTFSGNSNKQRWENSIKRDSLPWKSLWDGKGYKSKTIIGYQVTGYPTFCLIDPDGKIVDQWVGYGKDELKNKMKQHLKK